MNYLYLRVLGKKDRAVYLNHMKQKGYEELDKVIKYSEWINNLLEINDRLCCTYRIYRKAYWGENSGRTIISHNYMNYFCRLHVIGNIESKCIINILIHGNSITLIDNSNYMKDGKILISNFVNNNFDTSLWTVN